MSLGVGLGDILIVVNNGFRVCEAIRGSPAEHRELTLQLETLRRSLENINHLITDLQLPQSASELAEQQLSRCWQLLRSLDETITKYMKPSLSQGGSYKRRKNIPEEIKWAIYRRDQFFRLLGDLKNHFDPLDSLLQVYTTRIVQENNLILSRMENKVPMALDQWTDFKPIRFIDALDRQREFPFELCQQWDMFQDFLKLSFKDSDGKGWVDSGRYRISDESNGTVLTARKWNDNIEPGMTLSMAMLIQKRKDTNTTEQNCPVCDFPYIGVKNKDFERVRCKKCARWFQVSSQPRVQELGDSDIEPAGVEGSTDDRQFTDPIHSDASLELMSFRRIHVLLDIPDLLQENRIYIKPADLE